MSASKSFRNSRYGLPIRSLLALAFLLPATPSKCSPLPQAENLRTQARALVRHATKDDLLKAAKKLQTAAHLDGPNAARDYLALGEIYMTLSWFPQAREKFKRAMATGPDDIDLQCQALSDLADLESTLGHKTDSKENSDRAVAMAEKGASQRVKARALESQALALLYAQEPLTALDRLHPAKTLLTPNDVEELGSYFLYSGFADLTVNKTARALDDTILAHDTWQKAGDVYGVARANAALGLLWTTLGEPTRARAALNAAIATFRKIGDVEHQAVALNSLGVLSQANGDHDRSREYFRHARRLFAGIGDLVGEIGAMNSEADVLRSLRRFKGAENIYRSVFKLLDKDESGLYRPGAYLHLADIYASAGRWREADETYQKALSLRQERNEELTSSEVLFHLAAFYKSRERYQDAIQLLHRALDLSGAAERPDQVAQSHFELAGIYRNLAQLASAQGEIESAIHTIESQRNKLDDSESRAFYFSSVHSYCQLYIDILMDLYRQKGGEYAVRAFEAAEKSKVRSLLDVIDCRRSPADPAAGNADTDARIVGQAAPCDADALPLHDIQESIRGDHAILLEYAQGSGGKHGYLWVVDENGISVEDIPDFTRLESLAGKVLDAMTAMIPRGAESPLETSARFNRTKISYPRDAATLADALWGRVTDRLAHKRVIIVPDGELPDLPYATLIAGLPTDSAPASVVSLPSAALLALIRRRAGSRPRPSALAAVFANPVYNPGDRRIHAVGPRRSSPPPALAKVLKDLGLRPGSIPDLRNDEARYIAQAFPGEKILRAADFGATQYAVLHADLSRYRYLHFSVHGLLDTRYPEFSGLLLSLFNKKGEWQNGYLRIPDIYTLQVGADIVVLSACDSAVGKDMKSEGMIALPRAFLSAGARSVLSTLWKVNEDSTEQLMRSFYKYLSQGKAPDVALQLAQTDVRKNPRWSHPYYWAGFILQGDYRPATD